jgi:glycine/D-amino acid oxidase-like deaminating enzyme
MAKAVAWLTGNGFPASFERIGERQVQRDGAAAASLDISLTLSILEKQSRAEVRTNFVKAIRSGPTRVDVSLDDGTVVSSEMVIAACHVGIKELIPTMEHSLVNHADQWMEFKVTNGTLPLDPGDLVFTAHSHFWMSCSGSNTLRAGGARFLRNWAGIEADAAPIMPKITNTVRAKIEELFKADGLKLSDPVKVAGILDIRACDEIPIIGPMFGDSRILLASGYMGSGLTLGFAAGLGLAEFVNSGRSKVVPSVFHPNRLRSLTETD